MTTISTPIAEISPQNSELLREVQPLLDKITVLVKQLSPLHQLYLLQLIIQSLMQSLNHQPTVIPANTSPIDALAEMATLAQPLGPANLALNFDQYTQRVLSHDAT